MKKRRIGEAEKKAFLNFLYEGEKSRATIEKYARDLRSFCDFVGNDEISKATVIAYKETLEKSHTVSSANSMLAALNSFFRCMGWLDCTVRQFKVQKKVYSPEEKELSRVEYARLVRAAEQGKNERLSLIIQTICATGMRVSELSFITVCAVKSGEATVSCKGKKRTVFLISALRKKLLSYIKRSGIEHGMIFVTKSGKPIDRSNIWREMKALCQRAGVSPEKVFPHNLRHLFARTFYELEKDIAKLADILGHSSINTTRIYIMTTGAEHRRRMEKMRLIL